MKKTDERKMGFVRDLTLYILKGGKGYYSLLIFLSLVIILWFFALYYQFSNGLIVTNLTDHVVWGMYLSNFTFLVGVAAGAVTIVFPSYVYHHKQLKEVAVMGEMLGIAAIVMCLLFVIVHLGRPDRLLHIIPGIGIFNFPGSMLAWDVVVLNGYLILNLVCAFYYLYKKYKGEEVKKSFFMPIVYIAIVWALSIHTVTAFLYNTMPARGGWHHSILPIKFISTAFASGPAILIITFLIIRKKTKLKIGDEAIDMLSQIFVWCLGLGLFLMISEIVTSFYHLTEHAYGLRYLILGLHGYSKLVPWYWVSTIFMTFSFIFLLFPRLRKNHKLLPIVCVLSIIGIWIEKGLAFILPGFLPNSLGEIVEYSPSLVEIIISSGNWAVGLFLFVILVKGAIGILTKEVTAKV